MPNPNHTIIVNDMDINQRYKALWLVISEGKIGKVSRGEWKTYYEKHREQIRIKDRIRWAKRQAALSNQS